MIKTISNFHKHHALLSSNDVKSICSPLEELGRLEFFSFTRSYPDGSYNALTTVPEWSEYVLSNQLYKTSTFEQPPRLYHSSTILWSSMEEDEGRVALREFFQISDGVTLINKQEKYCDFFHFSIKNKGIPIYQNYVDWFDVLQKFSNYFIEQGSALIKESCKNKFLLNNTSEQQTLAASLVKSVSQGIGKNAISKIKLKNFRAIGHDTALKNLSYQECLVSAWLIKGKTLEETGIILGLAKKTVEEYMSNVKRKLNCTKPAELAYHLAMLGFDPNSYIS